MKDLKPIKFQRVSKVNLEGQLRMIGRAPVYRPYIAIEIGAAHAFVADKDVRRLRDWCNEILEKPKE
jgi:hypothetical protein